MIDLHSHILPGVDDGARDLETALEMARIAVADGIRIMVASPHLFKRKSVEAQYLNDKGTILAQLEQFKQELSAAEIPLEVVPGCDVPLCMEALQLLDKDMLLTINDTRAYLLLELPETSLPPSTEEICFSLKSKRITPIITHPERNFMIHEMPEKLARLLQLGCLAQLTAASLVGGFGRAVAKFSRQLIKKGQIHVMASDAHGTRGRPPKMRAAADELASLVGRERAWAMVSTLPGKILKGEPLFD